MSTRLDRDRSQRSLLLHFRLRLLPRSKRDLAVMDLKSTSHYGTVTNPATYPELYFVLAAANLRRPLQHQYKHKGKLFFQFSTCARKPRSAPGVFVYPLMSLFSLSLGQRTKHVPEWTARRQFRARSPKRSPVAYPEYSKYMRVSLVTCLSANDESRAVQTRIAAQRTHLYIPQSFSRFGSTTVSRGIGS